MAQHVLALLLSLVSLPSSRASEGSSRLENIEEVDVRVQRVSVSPAVFLIEGFLDATMCDAISAAARGSAGATCAISMPWPRPRGGCAA
jgi:hypothetical protein